MNDVHTWRRCRARKFDNVKLTSTVIRAPFPPESYIIDDATKAAIDQAYDNIFAFHNAQMDHTTLVVETMPGVVCQRFARPIEKVGLYVPGGTAILPSTALMLGIPAKVAGCKEIVIATPPRKDGTISPEIMYVAQKVGATVVLRAGGAQAVAAMAYGTESVPKVDKICGPGNQFVTAAKMMSQNDNFSLVSIDMPAGPSEVLVVAEQTSNPAYVASDLLSQAEHGTDSQVVLVAVDLSDDQLTAIEEEIKEQTKNLPRAAIVRKVISQSFTLRCPRPWSLSMTTRLNISFFRLKVLRSWLTWCRTQEACLSARIPQRVAEITLQGRITHCM